MCLRNDKFVLIEAKRVLTASVAKEIIFSQHFRHIKTNRTFAISPRKLTPS